MLLCLLFFLLCLCFPAVSGGGMKDGLLLVVRPGPARLISLYPPDNAFQISGRTL